MAYSTLQYTIIYFYQGKYDGLAPREKQYSLSLKGEVNIASRRELAPREKQYSLSLKGEVNIASRRELNHCIYRGKSKIIGYAPQFFSTAVKNGDESCTGMWRHL